MTPDTLNISDGTSTIKEKETNTTPQETEVTPNNKTPQETKVTMIDKTPQETRAKCIKKLPEQTLKRRTEVMKAIELTGGYGLPVKDIAARHGVNERIIYKDIEYLMKNVPKPDIMEIGKRFKISFETILKMAHRKLVDSDHKIQMDGAELILKAEERYRIFLEKYGYKELTERPEMVVVDNRQVNIGLSDDEKDKLLLLLKQRGKEE